MNLGQDPATIPTDLLPLALPPGGDLCLSMSWEPTIAVDPHTPSIIAAAQFLTIQISFDSGASFTQTLNATVPAGFGGQGDPSLGFDSQGRLFLTYLGAPASGRDVFISGYELDPIQGIFVPISGIGWPVNVTAGSGQGAPNNADKEWLAVDAFTGSPYQDRIYVTWTDLDQSPWQVWTTYSTDQGATWSPAQQLSAGIGGPKPWPVHNTVAPNGDVYVAYHVQPSYLDGGDQRVPDGQTGHIVLHRSSDGGDNFNGPFYPYGAGQADMTWNVQDKANGVIPGARFWLQGSSQPWILADPLVPGRIMVVANDDPDNDVDSGDAADVYIAISTDNGATWGAPIRVDQGPAGSFQVMPTAAIDPVTGAIAVVYYDNRAGQVNGSGNFLLDLIGTVSLDGGLTWAPEIVINDNPFDPDGTTSCRFCCDGASGCSDTPTTRIGEYNGIAFGSCLAYMVWAGNEVCGSGGSQLDTFFDRTSLLGGDGLAPQVNCPPDLDIGCTDPTGPDFTGEATAQDDCDPNPLVSYVDEVLAGDCPEGKVIYRIRRVWTVVDLALNDVSCEQLISIVDNDPPVITVPEPLVLECNSPGGVLLTDPAVQAWLAAASALDECSDVDFSHNAPALFPSGCPPLGQTTVVAFTATDDCGNSDTVFSSITVLDTTPPTLACSVELDTLWSPNHQFVDVGLSITASDLCDEAPVIAIAVTGDEDPALELGSGGPVHCPDALVDLASQTVQLRAERAGTGDGRVYRITVTATDSCGNANVCHATVSVPANQGKKGGAVDSGQALDATVCN